MNFHAAGLFLCVASACLAQPSTKTIPQTGTPQWEYRTVHADREVNELAGTGWELVTMTSGQEGNNYLLKRSKGKVDPILLYDIQPGYTKQAFKKHIQGDVTLSLMVTTAGLPTDVTVVKSLDPGLDQSAVAAVKQWRFRPSTEDGQAVDTRAQVATHFKITRGQKPRSWFIFIYP